MPDAKLVVQGDNDAGPELVIYDFDDPGLSVQETHNGHYSLLGYNSIGNDYNANLYILT